MNQLLAKILDARGDMNRWNEYYKVEVGGSLMAQHYVEEKGDRNESR